LYALPQINFFLNKFHLLPFLKSKGPIFINENLFRSFSEQDIDLRIQGRSDSGQSIDIRESTTVASDQTQIVRIRIGDLGQGSYTLISKGKSPIEFDQSQKLEYVHKGYSIFIQTDKAIYRPGDSILCFTNM